MIKEHVSAKERFVEMKHHKPKGGILTMGFIAALSLLWIILKTGTKPSRIVYPCQRAAVANVNIFLLGLFAPFLSLAMPSVKSPHVLNHRLTKTILLVGLLLLAFGPLTYTGNYPATENNDVPVELNLEPRSAATSVGSSNVFLIKDASGTNGNMDAAILTLVGLMQNHGLSFFKTSAQPNGLIAKDDVVLIKVNAVGPERAGTNTDLVKSLIKKIVNHPEGFNGEIVVADNGQGTGGLDLAESNAYDHSQSIQDVVNMFGSFKVSAWSWYQVRSNNVKEYSQGDYNNGYVVNSTENSITHLRVSYPKFKTKYGTYISFKNGIWNSATQSYASGKLKLINFPILKSHYNYGVTASIKNYMGVTSQTLTNSHDKIKYGSLGTEIAETRFPTLTLLDAIWVNANPMESGNNVGPPTPYEAASYTNVLGASQDPVALEYWASKHILMPAAAQKGYTSYSSLNPDYEPITPGLTESYHNYLERSVSQLKNANHQVTMNEAEINAYVSTPVSGYLFADGFESGSFSKWTGRSLSSGETASVVNTRSHHGIYSAKFTSSGSGGNEYAFSYKTIASSTELYARGYFYVSQSGIVQNDDRFYFIAFRAGSNNVAYAGWRKINGVVKWTLLIKSGTSSIVSYSTSSPALYRWYRVELHWTMSTSAGRGDLWVNGVKVASLSGRNTAALGSVNSVRFGLPLIANCGATRAYADCLVLSKNYIGSD